MGVITAVLYYVLFRFVIVRWNMRIPGRLPDDEFEAAQAAQLGDGAQPTERAERLISAFGGRDNLVAVDACITRLRMEVADKSKVDTEALTALGAAGVMEVGNNVQAVFGTQSDTLKDEINAALAGAAPAPEPEEPKEEAVVTPSGPTVVRAPIPGRAVPLSEVPDKTFATGDVGPGLAIEPAGDIVEAVAPVSGKLMQLLPHAYAIMTDDKVAVLVHLGIDTVTHMGEGFTLYASKGDRVTQGRPIITYDVPAVSATDHPTIVPVVVMDARGATVHDEADTDVSTIRPLFSVTKAPKK